LGYFIDISLKLKYFCGKRGDDMEGKETILRKFSLENAKNAENVIQKLAFYSKHGPTVTANFVMVRNSYICCYFEKTLYITDANLTPLFYYESTSNITACGISQDAKYIICQMAYNRNDDQDSEATILFSVPKRKAISRSKDVFIGHIRLMFIDSDKETISIYYADRFLGKDDNFVVKYDFMLTPDEGSVVAYYKKPDISPYALESRIDTLISRVLAGTQKPEDVAKDIAGYLRRMESSDMTKNRLSFTYKKVGDMYVTCGIKDEALNMYQAGLELNPKLAVKKAIKALTK